MYLSRLSFQRSYHSLAALLRLHPTPPSSTTSRPTSRSSQCAALPGHEPPGLPSLSRKWRSAPRLLLRRKDNVHMNRSFTIRTIVQRPRAHPSIPSRQLFNGPNTVPSPPSFCICRVPLFHFASLSSHIYTIVTLVNPSVLSAHPHVLPVSPLYLRQCGALHRPGPLPFSRSLRSSRFPLAL